MIKKYCIFLWKEITKEEIPLFAIEVLLIATICLTFSHDHKLISFIKSKTSDLSIFQYIKFHNLYYIITLFVLPSLFLKISGKNLKDFGLTFGKLKYSIPLFLLLFFVLTIFGFITAKMSSFKSYYGIINSLDVKDVSMLFMSNMAFMWGWEFIHRGFLIQGLKKNVGILAVFIQLVPFVILHLGKPSFEIYGSILFGLVFGLYAYISESFVFCALLHAYFATLINVLL